MRVFVSRSALTLAAAETVRVMGYYDDHAPVPAEMREPGLAMLSVAASALQPTQTLPELAPGWREANKAQIAYGEAEHRILAAFPDYSQRNSIAEMQKAITQHGAAPAQWPAAAQRRKAEADRAWAYVDAVRAKANAMLKGALPADPTADGHWPTRITPYQPG